MPVKKDSSFPLLKRGMKGDLMTFRKTNFSPNQTMMVS